MNVEQRRIDLSGVVGRPTALAHVSAFSLGPVMVEPSARRLVAAGGDELSITPLEMRVLVALVRADGATLSRDDLVSDCWETRIVGDDAINRVMSRLRRALASIAGKAVSIDTIAKVGYRLRLDHAPDPAAEAEHSTRGALLGGLKGGRRKKVLAALVAVSAAGATIAWQRPAAAPSVAIVVEPAGGAHAARDTSQFASDITSEVARLAGAVTRVMFVEPGSTRVSADMIARVSVEREQGATVSNVRLIDAGSGAVIWSQNFRAEGASDSILAERTSFAIAGVVRCGLDRSAGKYSDPVSMRLYFGACGAALEGDWAGAHSFAQQIVARNPDRAAGWACLAMTTVGLGRSTSRDPQAMAQEAERYARRALAIDPNYGFAIAALATALETDGKPTFEVLERGISIDPEHPPLQANYSRALFEAGYVDASVEPALHAIVLMPNARDLYEQAILRLIAVGRNEQADRLQAQIERLWGNEPDVLAQRAAMLRLEEDPAAAMAQYQRQPAADPMLDALVRTELEWRLDPGRFDWSGFDRAAERLYRLDPANAWQLALLSIRLKDKDRAFAWLERAPATASRTSSAGMFLPEAAELQRDPRFYAKMAQLGLVEFWRKRDQWPDFCSERGLKYDCRVEAARLSRT